MFGCLDVQGLRVQGLGFSVWVWMRMKLSSVLDEVALDGNVLG